MEIDEWKLMPQTKNNTLSNYLICIYHRLIISLWSTCLTKIKFDLYKHLQEFKQVHPNHAWKYYDNLLY